MLFTPILGSYISFNFRKNELKKELKRKIKHGIPDSELISIELTPEIIHSKTFSWHNSHEFRLNEKMYDIIKTTQKDNQIIYKVVCDDEESALFAQLENDLKDAFSNDPVQKSNGYKFYSFLKQMYFNENVALSFLDFSNSISKNYTLSKQKTYTNEFLKLTSPPPEFLIIS